MFKVPEKYRIRSGPFNSDISSGNNGAFKIKGKKGRKFTVIASDGMGWEHVSVSCQDRTPTWDEMCYIKSLFWDEQYVVIQFHPAKSDYVNNHQFCLHLWRPTNGEFPTPDPIQVGIPEKPLHCLQKIKL